LFLKTQTKVERNWLPPFPIILVGVPGTGKTILVLVLANEAKVPLIYQCLTSFSDTSANLTSTIFGRTVAARAVQRGFREARSQSPAIFFLDEIDALGASRNEPTFETKKTKWIANVPINTKSRDQVLGLGQLLVEIDGGSKNDGLVLFRSTNRPKELDPALIRPGRFHTVLSIPLPNKKKA
jgi:cell division protease FtsH